MGADVGSGDMASRRPNAVEGRGATGALGVAVGVRGGEGAGPDGVGRIPEGVRQGGRRFNDMLYGWRLRMGWLLPVVKQVS